MECFEYPARTEKLLMSLMPFIVIKLKSKQISPCLLNFGATCFKPTQVDWRNLKLQGQQLY
jgi:hypothetical protein